MARQSDPVAIPVLVTRPEPDGAEFAAVLQRLYPGRLRPVVAPLMAVRPLTPPLPPGAFVGVILTSAAAVPALAPLRAGLPDLAWCVGDKTAERARAAGFRAISAGGDADALVTVIRRAGVTGRLLHLRGEDTRGNVAERLNSAGIETESLVVYRQDPVPLSAEALDLLRRPGVVIVPLFSPRTARLFADALPQDRRADLRLVCMSPAVAEAAPKGMVLVADSPDAAAMARAVGRASG